MRAQSKLGHKIEGSVIADYEKVINKVDLASIDAREKQTRHDVKARIEEFNALAGHEAIHAGMTSRDLTENVEAMQIRDGLQLSHDRVVARVRAFAGLGRCHSGGHWHRTGGGPLGFVCF
jgi:adenylosuccinate lyase